MKNLKKFIKKVMPKQMFCIYYFLLALLGNIIYNAPSKHIRVIGITGTKGKTTVSQIIGAIFEKSGHKVAIANTIQFKIGDISKTNQMRMTMPGRFFLQKFLRNAVNAKCDIAIIEMTSEGASQYRHRFIALDALVFTNLAPEHIESHGSYENYRNAKLRLAHALQKSRKQNKAIIVNKDDKEGALFLAIDVENKYPYSLTQITDCSIHENGVDFNFNNTKIESSLKGEFNIYNILASIHCCTHFGIKITDIASALRVFGGVKGRMEYVQAGQDFSVIVDYAHTADSLRAIYTFLKQSGRKQPLLENRIICVLGGTGGGRDKWKRTVMGKTASEFCDYIILTNEDPYDEDPKRIIDEIASGIDNARYEKIIDRRQAIKTAIKRAQKNDIVIITGKGSDPCIMEKDGQKTPWSDVEVAQEEIKKLQFNNP